MIVGFSGFGFPKAHGAAFGLLAYQSTWLRVHYAPEFLCALLNEQPMGFYASDTLVHEAQRKGIEMLPPDVNLSGAGVHRRRGAARIRLGLDYVLGARSAEVAALVAARERGGPFRSLSELASRAGAGRAILDRLAWAGACDALAAAESRPRSAAPPSGRARGGTALWRLGVAAPGAPLKDGTQLALPLELPGAPALDPLAAWDAMVADYATTGVTLGAHPSRCCARAAGRRGLDPRPRARCAHETPVALGGLVVARQRPGTAKGIVFLLLEDEFGTINLIVPPDIYERHRLAVRTEPLLLAARPAGEAPDRRRGDQRLRALAAAAGRAGRRSRRRRHRAGRPRGARAAARTGSEAPGDGALADFRGVAPAVQSFAPQGRPPRDARPRAVGRTPPGASRAVRARRGKWVRSAPMAVLAFVALFVLLALGALFLAFGGASRGAKGQRAAAEPQRPARRDRAVLREHRRARHRRAGRRARLGRRPRLGSPRRTSRSSTRKQEHGRELFGQRCRNCHTLEAANATARSARTSTPAAQRGAGPRRDREGPRQRQRQHGRPDLRGRGRRGRRGVRRPRQRRRVESPGEEQQQTSEDEAAEE